MYSLFSGQVLPNQESRLEGIFSFPGKKSQKSDTEGPISENESSQNQSWEEQNLNLETLNKNVLKEDLEQKTSEFNTESIEVDTCSKKASEACLNHSMSNIRLNHRTSKGFYKFQRRQPLQTKPVLSLGAAFSPISENKPKEQTKKSVQKTQKPAQSHSTFVKKNQRNFLSRGLIVRGFNLDIWTIPRLNNFFSIFGNLESMIRDLGDSSVALLYASEKGLQNAQEGMASWQLGFMSSQMSQDHLNNLCRQSPALIDLQPKVSKRFSKKNNGLPVTVNLPSRTLHLTARESEKSAKFLSEIQLLALLPGLTDYIRMAKDYSTGACSPNMWFVELSSVPQAVWLLADLHGKKAEGFTFRISFTKDLA